MKLKAITFDVGETLMTPCPSVGSVYSEVAAGVGLGRVDPHELEQSFRHAWKGRQRFAHTRAAWASLVAEVFEGHVASPGDARLFEALWHRFAQAHAWRVFDDVVPVLAWCRRAGVRMAVVSNWDERLPGLLGQFEWSDAFEFVVASGPCGLMKPDPGIFMLAASRLGLQPSEILHVGDSRREDFEGARRAGFAGAWLCRADGGEEPGRIRSLLELQDWVEGGRAGSRLDG